MTFPYTSSNFLSSPTLSSLFHDVKFAVAFHMISQVYSDLHYKNNLSQNLLEGNFNT